MAAQLKHLQLSFLGWGSGPGPLSWCGHRGEARGDSHRVAAIGREQEIDCKIHKVCYWEWHRKPTRMRWDSSSNGSDGQCAVRAHQMSPAVGRALSHVNWTKAHNSPGRLAHSQLSVALPPLPPSRLVLAKPFPALWKWCWAQWRVLSTVTSVEHKPDFVKSHRSFPCGTKTCMTWPCYLWVSPPSPLPPLGSSPEEHRAPVPTSGAHVPRPCSVCGLRTWAPFASNAHHPLLDQLNLWALSSSVASSGKAPSRSQGL